MCKESASCDTGQSLDGSDGTMLMYAADATSRCRVTFHTSHRPERARLPMVSVVLTMRSLSPGIAGEWNIIFKDCCTPNTPWAPVEALRT